LKLSDLRTTDVGCDGKLDVVTTAGNKIAVFIAK
jgi:hypothetical protein